MNEIHEPGQDDADEVGSAVVRFVSELRFEDIPDEIVEKAKMCLGDVLASAIAGTVAEGIQDLVELLSRWGGRPEATILGFDARVPAPLAALANAAIARALELDDVHERALVHPTVAVAPVALAVAEAEGGVTGRELLCTLVAAEEIVCRLGLAPEYHVAGSEHRPRGWSATYQCGILGAVLAAARILSLPRRQSLDALGNAYMALAGNQQGLQEGSLAVRVQQGLGAQTAVQSAYLAAQGITGPHCAFEGRFGWLTFWQGGRYSKPAILSGLGTDWSMGDISLKLFPCSKITHNAITATLEVMRRDDGGPEPWENVERLLVHVNSRESWTSVVEPIERRRVPQSTVEAQLSMPYVCAVAAVTGTVNLAGLSAERIRDRQVMEMAQRVDCVLDPEADVSRGRILPMPITVDLVLKGGQRRSATANFPIGHPNRPFTWTTIEEKLAECNAWAGHYMPPKRLRDLLDTVQRLDKLQDLQHLTELFRGSSR